METETYRYTKTASGYTVTRRSDLKVIGSIVRVEESYPTGRSRTGRSRMNTAVFFEAFAAGETTRRAAPAKREAAARHLDALDRARAETYRKGDTVSCYFPEGNLGSSVEIERVDGEHLYIVGHRTPITREAIRVWTPSEPLPVYAA